MIHPSVNVLTRSGPKRIDEVGEGEEVYAVNGDGRSYLAEARPIVLQGDGERWVSIRCPGLDLLATEGTEVLLERGPSTIDEIVPGDRCISGFRRLDETGNGVDDATMSIRATLNAVSGTVAVGESGLAIRFLGGTETASLVFDAVRCAGLDMAQVERKRKGGAQRGYQTVLVPIDGKEDIVDLHEKLGTVGIGPRTLSLALEDLRSIAWYAQRFVNSVPYMSELGASWLQWAWTLLGHASWIAELLLLESDPEYRFLEGSTARQVHVSRSRVWPKYSTMERHTKTDPIVKGATLKIAGGWFLAMWKGYAFAVRGIDG